MAEDSAEEYGEEYEVEALRAWRYVKDEKAFECLIKWVNYSESENTWESALYLTCPKMVKRFKRTLSKEDRRNFELEDKNELNGFERHAIFKGIVGTEEPEDRENRIPSGTRVKFHVLVSFDDCKEPEAFNLFDLHKHRPEETFKFCEQRLFKRQKISEQED